MTKAKFDEMSPGRRAASSAEPGDLAHKSQNNAPRGGVPPGVAKAGLCPWAAALLLPWLCPACADDGLCATEGGSCELRHTFPDVTLARGQEIVNLCQSWTLQNPGELWVTTVEQTNQRFYHHSNWFFVPDVPGSSFDLPDGVWDCDAHGFKELNAATSGGYLFAQSTQVTGEVQSFAKGAAIRVPPYSRIIGSTHLLNPSDQQQTTSISLRIALAPAKQVTVKLTPARLTYYDLHIPANASRDATSEFTAKCPIAAEHQQKVGRPWEFSLYHFLPHYHELGIYAELVIDGGPLDGQVLFRHEGYGEPFGRAFDPPLDLGAMGAEGLRYTCGFRNTRAREVVWGVGEQEMCVAALLAETEMAFEGIVGQNLIAGTAPDGKTIQNQGKCQVAGFLWSHDNPGGTPRQ